MNTNEAIEEKINQMILTKRVMRVTTDQVTLDVLEKELIKDQIMITLWAMNEV